jgi:hypothetical protein
LKIESSETRLVVSFLERDIVNHLKTVVTLFCSLFLFSWPIVDHDFLIRLLFSLTPFLTPFVAVSWVDNNAKATGKIVTSNHGA